MVDPINLKFPVVDPINLKFPFPVVDPINLPSFKVHELDSIVSGVAPIQPFKVVIQC